MYLKILEEIKSHQNKEKARLLSGFFKTGKGQYGEGDVFWGLTVPISRKIAIKYKNINLSEIEKLLKSKVHEVRLIALLILVYKYQTGTEKEHEQIYKFYLKNTKYINNWDLVDLSAPKIVGKYLINQKDRKILFKLAHSGFLWEERIAILATFAFIRIGDFNETLKIAEIFLKHPHDLIHKATGWMLREVGKKDLKVLQKFLDKNIKNMPRTMLRYAIEKFPEKTRLEYLKK